MRDGICVDPPLCRGTSQGKYGSRTIDFVCAGETVGKIREVNEMGERELGLVVSVRCGKEFHAVFFPVTDGTTSIARRHLLQLIDGFSCAPCTVRASLRLIRASCS